MQYEIIMQMKMRYLLFYRLNRMHKCFSLKLKRYFKDIFILML